MSVLIFQSFVTFYVIKYFNWIEGAIIGNMILYLAMACGYLAVSWSNHQKPLSVRTWFFAGLVLCIWATSMMQRKTIWLLLLWYALLWFGKGIYFCCLYLYEFAYVEKEDRVRYAGIQSSWKSVTEIIIPLVLWYFFSIVALPQQVYLGIFILAALMLVITALIVYDLPDITLPPTHHTHYKTILKHTWAPNIIYLSLIGINVMIPFIATLLEVYILQKESWMWLFQSITKIVTLGLLLLILHFFHSTRGFRQLIFTSIALGVMLLVAPRWSWWIVLIIYALAKSFLFPLFSTYEKSVGMHIMDTMVKPWESMLPVIIIQVILYAIIRALLFGVAYLFLYTWSSIYSLIIVLTTITGIGFITIALSILVLYTSPRRHIPA